jgi:hypothetical protein
VQTPDDEQFEVYLKRFHPIAPEPVPTLRVGHSCYRSGYFAYQVPTETERRDGSNCG